jgi:acylglycerol lipase
VNVSTGSILGCDNTVLRTRRWEVDDPRAQMIIVHGVSEHLGRWGHVAEFFAGRGIAVMAYDHRGHGCSAGDRIHVDDFEHFVLDLGVVIDAARTDLPLIVYGHSLGGLITAAYAEGEGTQPDLYVLSAPALDANAPQALRTAATVIGRFLPKVRMPTPVDGSQLSRDESVGEAYLSDPLVVLAGTARFGSEVLAAMNRTRSNVLSIEVPTLVIHGGDDELVPPAASAPLAAAGAVERRVFPGLRHEMHNEPEAADVLGFVASWLDDHLARL